MTSDTTKMSAELRAENFLSIAERYIASVTLSDECTVTTDVGLCDAFRSYFQSIFTRMPGLTPTQFDTYMVDFPRHEATVAPRCEGAIKEEEI